MENQRYSQWIENSKGLFYVEMLLFNDCIGLGVLDSELIEEFPTLKLNSELEKDRYNKFKHVFLSRLWVFGAYELIRTINEINKKRPLLPEKSKEKLKEILTLFNNVRTPLAKFQKSGEKRLFSQVATQLVFDKENGLGWHFYDGKMGTVFFRKDLGDKLLELLEAIKLGSEK